MAQGICLPVDTLLGKPMPIKTAQYFCKHFESGNQKLNPFQQIQWLIDTEKRLVEYLDLAKKLRQPLRINLEIDMGLYRGNFSSLTTLANGLKILQENKTWLTFSSLMGYNPHIVKLPSIIRSQQKTLQLANDFHHHCRTLIKNDFPIL